MKLANGLNEKAQSFILSESAFRLQALGRLVEAVPLMQSGLESDIALGDWKNACAVSGNLSDLYLSLGLIDHAWNYANKVSEIAIQNDDSFFKLASRVFKGNCLFQQGRLIKAKEIFQEAGKIQSKREPVYPFLYSFQGFLYCQLLLTLGRYREVTDLAEKGLKWADQGGRIRDIALDHLALGQAHLSLTLAERSLDYSRTTAYLDNAVAELRQAGREDDIVLALLSRVRLNLLQNDWQRAHRDLYEAMTRAKRSGMALLQTDAHLEYVRLYLAQGLPEKARPHLATAKKMIADLGYGRRRQDVLDLEAQLRRIH